MSIDIPGELQWLGWVAGSAWPQGDEDAMWDIASEWSTAARQLRDLIPELEAAKKATIAAYPWGDGVEAMVTALNNLDSGPQSFQALADILDQVSEAADGLGTEIEYTKIMILSSLGMLAVEIALAWCFPPTAPAEEAAATLITRTAVRLLGERAVSAIARYAEKLGVAALARFLAKHVVISTALGAGQDVAIQGLQIAEGHRKGMDWERVGMTALTAAAAGAAGGPAGEIFGKAATRLPFAGNPFGDAVRGALVGTGAGIAGAFASWGVGGLPTLITEGTTDGWTWDPRLLTSATSYGVLTGATKGFRLPTGGGVHPGSFEAPPGARMNMPTGGDGSAPAAHPEPATTSHPTATPDPSGAPAGTPHPQSTATGLFTGDPGAQTHTSATSSTTESPRPLTNLFGGPGTRTEPSSAPDSGTHGTSSRAAEPGSRGGTSPASESSIRGTTPTGESGPRTSTSPTAESNSRPGGSTAPEPNSRAGNPAASEPNSRAGNSAASEPNPRAGSPSGGDTTGRGANPATSEPGSRAGSPSATEPGTRAGTDPANPSRPATGGPAAESRTGAPARGDGSAPVPTRSEPVAVHESGTEPKGGSATETRPGSGGTGGPEPRPHERDPVSGGEPEPQPQSSRGPESTPESGENAGPEPQPGRPRTAAEALDSARALLRSLGIDPEGMSPEHMGRAGMDAVMRRTAELSDAQARLDEANLRPDKYFEEREGIQQRMRDLGDIRRQLRADLDDYRRAGQAENPATPTRPAPDPRSATEPRQTRAPEAGPEPTPEAEPGQQPEPRSGMKPEPESGAKPESDGSAGPEPKTASEPALESLQEQVRSLGVDPHGLSSEQLRRAGLEAVVRRLSELDGDYGRLIDDFGQFAEKFGGEVGDGPTHAAPESKPSGDTEPGPAQPPHGGESAPAKQPAEGGNSESPRPGEARDPRLAWRLPAEDAGPAPESGSLVRGQDPRLAWRLPEEGEGSTPEPQRQRGVEDPRLTWRLPVEGEGSAPESGGPVRGQDPRLTWGLPEEGEGSTPEPQRQRGVEDPRLTWRLPVEGEGSAPESGGPVRGQDPRLAWGLPEEGEGSTPESGAHAPGQDPRLTWRVPPGSEDPTVELQRPPHDDDVPDTTSLIPYTPRYFSIPPIPEYTAPAPPPESVWEPEQPPKPAPPPHPGPDPKPVHPHPPTPAPPHPPRRPRHGDSHEQG
ncbi:WXG100-like domain-containing protein [Nocardia sp. NPDC004711]